MYVGNRTWTSAIFLAAIACAVQRRRTSREMSLTAAGSEPAATDFRTTGQKWSSDEYQTLSSLTSDGPAIRPPTSGTPASNGPDAQDGEETAENPSYPALPTGPSPPVFITRNGAGGYVRNPYAYVPDGGRGHRVQDRDVDQHSEYAMSDAVPKWNRLYANHRQLKKYGPVIMETGVGLDSDGAYNVYDNGVEYNTVKTYESETNNNYKHNGGSGGGGGGQGGQGNAGHGTYGLYNEPPAAQWSRPANYETEPRKPGHGTTVDVKKLGMLAAIKLGLFKLKLLILNKFLLTLAVKLKTILLFKLKLLFKLFLLKKILKLIVLPVLPGVLPLLQKLLNPMMPSSPMNMMMMPMMNGMDGNRFRNDSIEPVHRRNAAGNFGDETANLVKFAATIYSAKCIERMACTAAAGGQPNLQSMLINWILSVFVSYIPSKNLNLYVSTFKDVSNSRIENIFNPPRSTDELWKWCDEHYPCEDENTDEN